MRVTYVVHQFLPDYFTGTEQYTFAVAKEMQRRGHDVDVFALDPDFSERAPFWEERDEVVEGLPVRRFRYWMHVGADFRELEFRHPFAGYRFAEHLRARRPDVVHAFHLRHVGANLLDEASAQGIGTVVHLMDFWFLCPAVTLLHRDGSLCEGPPDGGRGCAPCVAPGADAAELYAERPRYLRERLLTADRIVAPSRFLRDVFVRNGYPADAIDVVGYGVDRARLAGIERAPSATLRIGFFGSISPHKGTDLAVDAVLATPGDLRLSVFGRTTDFPEFSAPLVARAADDPRIEFRPPFPREELGRALGEIDVLVVPSRWHENTPFVVLEAFAGGVPVVATDLGGTAELVEDGVCGDLFRRGDAADLAAKLARLVADRGRLARYAAALPAVKSLAANVDEIEAVYAVATR